MFDVVVHPIDGKPPMKNWIMLGTLACIATSSTSSFAQDTFPEPRREPPKEHTGFQLSLRPGVAIPFGDIARELAMSDLTTAQFSPLIVSVGGKIIPELYLGGYFGWQFGGPAGALKEVCDRVDDGGCLTGSLRFGVEAQVSLLPAQFVNPWVGYGFGFETLGIAESSNGATQSRWYSGLEFARISAGADFRINRIFGVGPYADFAVGRFTRVSIDDDSRDIVDDSRKTHAWLTIGARFVFFP
jgi:hypothetical protein